MGYTSANYEYVKSLDNLSPIQQKWLDQIEDSYTLSEKGLFTVKKNEDNVEGSLRDFTPEALVIAVMLSQAIKEQAGDQLEEVLLTLDQEDIQKFVRQYDILSQITSDTYEGTGVKKRIEGSIEDLIFKGSIVGSGTAATIQNSLRYHEIKAGVSKQIGFFANNYASRIVQPKINEKIAAVAAGEVADSAEAFKGIRDQVRKNFQDSGYWRQIAHREASTSYHYGLLKAGESLDYRKYRYTAVLDTRTSPICKKLNGTEYFVGNALSRVEQLASMDAEDLMATNVFLDEESDLDELQKSGAPIPPQEHAGECRSTIVLVE